jgi:hypothetical protein
LIHATTPRERAALAAIRANGLHVEPIGTAGAVRVFGHGVYVLLAWIGSVHPIDLQPVHEFHRRDQR